jgi:hypothetical protein
MTTTEAPKKIKIAMSERRPLSIDPEQWPLIARADRHDGKVACQANHEWSIRVREHSDGRRIVYGYLRSGNGGTYAGWRGAEGGFLVPSSDTPRYRDDTLAGRPVKLIDSYAPDESETVRAIRRVGGIIDDDRLADECIADLPAETIEAEEEAPIAAAVSNDTLATLLALLVQAVPHVPEPLKSEIRAAVGGSV